MATVRLIGDDEAGPEVRAVFDDIRATRNTDFVNNIWRGLANDPALLRRTWEEVKAVMATPGSLDPLTKELIYLAVSVANACEYCAHSHTAAARAKGMTEQQYAEVLTIIGLAAKTNHLSSALQIPVDDAFKA